MYEHYSVKRSLRYAKLKSRARRFENCVCRTFKLFKFILVIAAFFGMYKFAYASFWKLSDNMFTSGENIEYKGNSIVSNERIFEEIKKTAPENLPLYLFNPDKMTEALEKLPPVKKAYIRRYIFPARLVIMLQEVQAAVLIMPSYDAPEIAAVSFDGVFIDQSYLPLKDKGSAVKVLTGGAAQEDYRKWDEKKAAMLFRLAKTLESYSNEKLLYIDLQNPEDAFAQLESVKVRLGALDYGIFQRIKALNSIIKSEEVKNLASSSAFIDLSWSQVQYINTGSPR